MRRVASEARISGPYDLDRTIAFVHGPDDPFLAREGDGAWVGALRTRGGPALVRISRVAAGVRLEAKAATSLAVDEALASARRLAGLDLPGRPDHQATFRRRLAAEPALAPVVRASRGLRLPHRADPVAAVSGAILAQQVTGSFARQLAHELWARHGESVELEGRRWALPPRAETLAAIEPGSLLAMKISRRKGEYIRDLSNEIALGTLDLHGLRDLPAEEAERLLVARRGIGPTTAAWLLMFGAAHPDAWPPADVGLLRVLEALVGTGTGRKAQALVERFRGVRSHLAIALWAAGREVRAAREVSARARPKASAGSASARGRSRRG